VDGYLSPLHYLHMHYAGQQYVGVARFTLTAVDNRAANIVTYRDIERASVDFYASVRNLYRQRRQHQVEDSNATTTELPDF
jgi:phospholipid-binding lipoprotein MlaA